MFMRNAFQIMCEADDNTWLKGSLRTATRCIAQLPRPNDAGPQSNRRLSRRHTLIRYMLIFPSSRATIAPSESAPAT